MLKWFRDLRSQYRYTKAFKQVSKEKYEAGEITKETYDDCVRAAKSSKVMRQSRNQLVADPNMLGGISDWDWDTIYAWFVEYFIPAMKVIIPIVIMFLGPNPTEDE